MLGGLFRALAREGNTIVLAERHLPERWAGAAGEGTAAGPFLVYRLPVPAVATPPGESPVAAPPAAGAAQGGGA
jgi:hypothetical protein